MGDDGASKWVQLDVPDWLFAGHPDEIFRISALISRVDAPGGSTWRRVTTEEAYHRRAPKLVELSPINLLDGSVAPASQASIASLIRDDLERPVLEAVRERTDQEISRLSGNPILVASYTARLRVSTALGPDELAQAVAHGVRTLSSLVLEGTGESALGHVQAWTVRRHDSLVSRLTLMAMLLRLRVDTQLAAGNTKEIKAELEREGGVFKSSQRLVDGIAMLDPYLGPLVASLSPSVWGVLCPRLNGSVLLSFGTGVAGSPGVPHSMLETVATRGAEFGYVAARFSRAEAPGEAIEWWVDALNRLFGWLSDPVVFADSNNAYDPLAQLETVASFEQVFRRVLSIQTLHRDATARTALMFSVLDTLETLTGLKQEKLYSLSHAEKTLAGLVTALGAGDEVLLPAAARAVDALRAVSDGFFLRDPAGRVPLRDGQEPVTPENAVVFYLQMLRDAGHGFGSDRPHKWEIDANLMVRHTGATHHDLALLPWLYLLDMLANPERIRGIFVTRTRRGVRAA